MTIRTKLINRRYRLERRIRLSETSETWLGFDNVLHRAVAVTVPRQELLRNAPFRVEFLQRSRIATALHHRSIVAAFDSGEDGETPYLIAEYTGGEQLTNIIQSEAPFDVDDVAILVEHVAGALDYAHQRGFVHGALTGADILVDPQGVAKVLGLGLPARSAVWTKGNGQREALTFDDDVQALARVAFEMLTGEEPDAMESGSSGEAYAIDPEVPRNASDIVAIGLGDGPARFSSAGSFARALRDWRSFDAADYEVPQDLEEESDVGTAEVERSTAPARPTVEADDWFEDEVPISTSETNARIPSSGVRIALVAALLLAVLAGFLIWQGSEAAAGPTVVPPEIESLAELSGF